MHDSQMRLRQHRLVVAWGHTRVGSIFESVRCLGPAPRRRPQAMTSLANYRDKFSSGPIHLIKFSSRLSDRSGGFSGLWPSWLVYGRWSAPCVRAPSDVMCGLEHFLTGRPKLFMHHQGLACVGFESEYSCTFRALLISSNPMNKGDGSTCAPTAF